MCCNNEAIVPELSARAATPCLQSPNGRPLWTPGANLWQEPVPAMARHRVRPGRRLDALQGRNDYEVAYFLMSGLHLATGLPIARLLGKPIIMKFSCSSLVVGMRQSFLGRLELASCGDGPRESLF